MVERGFAGSSRCSQEEEEEEEEEEGQPVQTYNSHGYRHWPNDKILIQLPYLIQHT